MAVFHLHMQVISRSAGRSAISASAYRAADRIIDERTGLEHDYTRKGGVAHSEVMLPAGMPDAMRDREILWNSVEAAEKADCAQLAREFDAALPLELSRDEQIAFARDFIQREFVDRGMAADWALHDPVDRITGRRDNPHIHCMATMREWDPEKGCWAAKYRKEYLCRDDSGREEYLSPADLRSRADEGWAKVYNYRSAGNLTQAEAARRGLANSDRSSKSPLDRAVAPNDWNTTERLVAWREEWARTQNEALERHYEREQTLETERAFVDHRSYADQGRDELIPTKHMGPERTAIEEKEMRACEREGREYEPVTARGRYNAETREANRLAERLRELMREQARAIAEKAREMAERAKDVFEKARDRFEEVARSGRDRDTVERCCDEFRRVSDADERIADLRDELRSGGLSYWEQGEIRSAEHAAWVARGQVEKLSREGSAILAEKSDLERRMADLSAHPILNRGEIRHVGEELAKTETRLQECTRSISDACTRRDKAESELEPLRSRERAAEAATAAIEAKIENAERDRGESLERAERLYARLPENLRDKVDDCMSRERNDVHEDLLERQGRDRDEEHILRHEVDPVRRCARLIDNINSKERLWDDRGAISRAGKELEGLDGPSRERVMARTDGIGYASWDDVREQRRGTLSQDISQAVEASRAIAEEARAYERDSWSRER